MPSGTRCWLIILGCPRSGTTFLEEVLARADGYVSAKGNEVFPSQTAAIWNADLSEDVRDAIRVSLRVALEYFLLGKEDSRAEAIAEWLRGHIGTVELSKALRRILHLTGLIYREPFLAFAPYLAYGALPDCRIVHIYRDGRDAADSLVRTYDVLTDEKLKDGESLEVTLGHRHGDLLVPWWVDSARHREFLDASQYVRAIWMWSVMVSRAHTFATSPEVVSSGRVIEICYESLVNDPLTEGERVIDHFRLRMNLRIRRQLQKADIRSVGIHQRLDSAELLAANKVAAKQLETLGYVPR